MNDIWLIVKKEWVGFVKSDKWIFVIYSVLIIAWSFLAASNLAALVSGAGYLWLVFFSVIISGNFSNSTFVAERMNGSLEILLTAGISRQGILFGKIFFIVLISSILGVLCYTAALVITVFQGQDLGVMFLILPVGKAMSLYAVACFMNAACGAWLSIRITNPRLLPFVNLFVLFIIVVMHSVLSDVFSLSLWSLAVSLAVAGGVFTFLALKEFKSERVVQPVVY
jgi:ABC-type Na+ efflux pump permease subunit